MTAWRRPEYLAETLEALDVASAEIDEPVLTVAYVEPGFPEVRNMLLDRGRGTWVFENVKRLGLQRNTRAAIEQAFALGRKVGEDYVLGLPDDLVLAPDALRLAAWMRERFRDEPDVLYTSLFTSESVCGPAHWHRVVTSEWFHCQGWGTWQNRWLHEWRPRWNLDGRYDSWDSNVNVNVMRGRLQALPRLARCRHIGLLDGEHSTPELFKKDLPKLFAGDLHLSREEYWTDADRG
jgi:hypothetical protein